jgi:hypothetical protein
MSAVIKGAEELRSLLSGIAPKVLPDLGAPLMLGALDVVTRAEMLVPRESGDLADSAFVDGPEINRRTLSVTTTAGFEAAHAAYVHEGVHGGAHIRPPKFLELATVGLEEHLAEAVGDALMTAVERNRR